MDLITEMRTLYAIMQALEAAMLAIPPGTDLFHQVGASRDGVSGVLHALATRAGCSTLVLTERHLLDDWIAELGTQP